MNIDAENDKLIRALRELSERDKKLVKSTPYPAPADSSIIVSSWKMNEFKYAVHPSPFPTLARGLFTRWIPDGPEEDGIKEGDGAGRHTIVARGYDKFFNIGEVPWNTWESFERHTKAPYYLTLKSNGCIIFIAALDSTKLIVTSKHSVGQRNENETSHAMMGEQWLLKHLKSKGKTLEDLAARLHADNLTAVAELCDDSFEEHVLGYAAELTGLHLHGLNHNTGAFSTLPPHNVDAFAAEYGFIQTATLEMNSIKEVRAFTDKIGETGSWKGEAVEGFVVRTYVAHATPSVSPEAALPTKTPRSRDQSGVAPPYPPNSDFFFKVKFDEPYLMYRAWREITKSILGHRSRHDKTKPLSIPKSRLARPESRVYRDWVEKEINANPKEFAEFNSGHNIIATRERFLKWLATEEGKQALAKAAEPSGSPTITQTTSSTTEANWGKTVIVPIAVPGCGKTAVSVALAKLFGFAHTQSDDVQAKKTAPTFQKNITNLLKDNLVVIADRNNHLTQHRAGIREAANRAATSQPVRLVALNWSTRSLPLATVHRICSDRVLARGANHQTLRGSLDQRTKHEDVIWQFITNGEELGENEVDAVVEMDVRDANLEDSVTRAVDGLVPLLQLERPSEGQILQACEHALEYRTDLRKRSELQDKAKKPRYFGLLVEVNLSEIVNPFVSSATSPKIAQTLWATLRDNGRLTPRPHVTIVHGKSIAAGESNSQELWDACAALNEAPSPPLLTYTLGTLVFSDRVMAITVDDLALEREDKAGRAFIDKLPDNVRGRLHVTIGTRDAEVPPVEARDLVERWRSGDASVHAVQLNGTKGVGRIKGLY